MVELEVILADVEELESGDEDTGVVDDEDDDATVELAVEATELEDAMGEDDKLDELMPALADDVEDDTGEADIDDPAAAICLAPHTSLFVDALTMLLFM